MQLPLGQTFDFPDILTILVLILLEGILSGDNALVLTVLVLPLKEEDQRKALRYGIIGAYVLRTIATLLAAVMIKAKWVFLLGGLYLLWLPFKHFTSHPDAEPEEGAAPAVAAAGFLGLSVFWSTVVKVELTDMVFAVDSILAAVGMTGGHPEKVWVVIVGGILGITMMRLLTLQVLELVKKYPKLIDGAYVVVAWVGIKLLVEYAHDMHWIPFHVDKWLSLGVVITLFIGSWFYAKSHPAEDPELVAAAGGAEVLLSPEGGAEK